MKLSTFVVAAALLLPASHTSAQGVTDAQIAAIVVTANQVDIDAGKLASSMSSNGDVKKFADLMVAAHTSVNKSAVELVTKLKVSPEDNPTSQSLKAGGDKNVANLRRSRGRHSTRPISITRSRTTSRCSTPSTRRSSRAPAIPS